MGQEAHRPNQLSSAGQAAESGWSVRALSGPMKGQVLKVIPGLPLVVGRASNADMILAGDEQVSRRHAKLTTIGERLFIEDLKSTNKTFVNGEEISVVQLNHDDRIKIGNTTLEVIGPVNPFKKPVVHEALEDGDMGTHIEERQRSIMEGSLAEVTLPDLLQLFSAGEMSITVHMGREDRAGHVYVRKGSIKSSTIDQVTLPAAEALYELLAWDRGEFAVVLDDSEFTSEEIELPFHEIMMEFMGRLEEPTDMTIDIDVAELPPESEPGLRTTMLGEAFGFEAPLIDEEERTHTEELPSNMPISGEELALSNLPWRTEMSGDTLDRETLTLIAASLNNHSEKDWADLKEVAMTTMTWVDEIMIGFEELRNDPQRRAALFGSTDPVPDEAGEACHKVVSGWLGSILPGNGDDSLYREAWIAGLMHLSKGVRTVYFLSWMSRLQECFRKKCFETFDPQHALVVSSAFSRITCTAVALAIEARETGLRLSVLNFGVNAGLLHKMEVQMAWRLIAAARKSFEE